MAEALNRFRVRAGHKTYRDAGPDLLRERSRARASLRAMLGPAVDLHKPQVNTGDGFEDVASKAAVLDAFDAWKPGKTIGASDDNFQVSEMRDGRRVIVAAVRYERVPVHEATCGHPGCTEMRSLIEHQFGDKVTYAGCYVYKQIAGSTSWSDHAYGDAIDETFGSALNDAGFDWVVRMARAKEFDFDYALGSKDGKVVSASAPDYDVHPSSAASTHLWHVHISQVDHEGRKPAHEGGHC